MDLGFFNITATDEDHEMKDPESSIIEPTNTIITSTNKRTRPNANPAKKIQKKNMDLSFLKKDWLKEKYKSQTISKIWSEFLCYFSNEIIPALSILDSGSYLEFLWDKFSSSASSDHLLSLVLLINFKKSNQLFVFLSQKESFSTFVMTVFENILTLESYEAKSILLIFLIHFFSCMDIPLVRTICMSFVNISIWHNLNDSYKNELVSQHSQLEKLWSNQEKKLKKADEVNKKELLFQRSFLSQLFALFSNLLSSSDQLTDPQTVFCERVIDLLIDLLSQLPTRRYVNALVLDHGILITCINSTLYKTGKINFQLQKEAKEFEEYGILFYRFVGRLDKFVYFPIHDQTGLSLTHQELEHLHYERLIKLQKTLFTNYKDEFEEFILMNIASAEKESILHSTFSKISFELLSMVANDMGIRIKNINDSKEPIEHDMLIALFVDKFKRRPYIFDDVENIPIYPTDINIFGHASLIDSDKIDFFHPLCLPKLNLQFLNIQEYVYRLFQTYILHVSVEMRHHVESIVKKANPRHDSEMLSTAYQTIFAGVTRFGTPVESCKLVDVSPPLIGQIKPSRVIMDVTYDLNKFLDASLRDEWDGLRMGDVFYLCAIEAQPILKALDNEYKETTTGTLFQKAYGLRAIRGCHIIGLIGDDGKLMGSFDDNIIYSIITAVKKLPPDQLNKHRKDTILEEIEKSGFSKGIYGSKRTLRVALDVNQYSHDVFQFGDAKAVESQYKNFNYMIRREPRQNSCKSVVEGMKEFIIAASGSSKSNFLPDWLRDIVLGLGDMNSPYFSNLKNVHRTMMFGNVLIDKNHVKESFPDRKVVFHETKPGLPFLVTFPESDYPNFENNINPRGVDLQIELMQQKIYPDENHVSAVNYKPVYYGPFAIEFDHIEPKYRFDPDQVSAIRAGISEGLTLINGGYGTGKTEVTAHLIVELMRNHPEQRILIVSSSQTSMNNLFEKTLSYSAFDPSFFIRLGYDSGDSFTATESQLETDKNGRLSQFTTKRLDMLDRVDKLAASLDITGAYGNSCETAVYFYQTHIQPRWERYHHRIHNEYEKTAKSVIDHFPFREHFKTQAQLFPNDSTFDSAFIIAQGCYRYLEDMFSQLENMRPFEILRTNSDRLNYLVVKEARVLCMTTSIAGLKRPILNRHGFTFDTVIFEDASCSTEVDTVITLQLQSTLSGKSRLKRVIMVGNENLKFSEIKHQALTKNTNSFQSMFNRLLRNGVPRFDLNKNYRLDYSMSERSAGFCFNQQFINVPTYFSKDETKPRANQPFYIQNLGEAEYCVAVYMFMRCIGYPKESISILALTFGQRDLIVDVLNKRWSPFFGKPAHVTTVEGMIGLENQHVLVSLVRTVDSYESDFIESIDFSLTRAKKQMIVFGRYDVMKSLPSIQKLCETRPLELWINEKEKYGERVGDIHVKCDKKHVYFCGDEGVFKIDGVEALGQWVYLKAQEQVMMLRENQSGVGK